MFDKLLSTDNFSELYVVLRWLYKNNLEIVDNAVFDQIEEIVREENSDLEHLSKSWVEDKEPVELLKKYRIDLSSVGVANVTPLIKKHLNLLLENGSISITPIRDYAKAKEWFDENAESALCASVKIDGVNTKEVFNRTNGKLVVASSRGRHSEDLQDYTDTAMEVLNGKLELDLSKLVGEHVISYAEGYMDVEGRELMKAFYNDESKYVTGRSTGLAVLRAGCPEHIMKHMHLAFFKIKDYSDKLSNTLTQLSRAGYEVPYFERIVYPGDMSIKDFKEWLDSVLYKFRVKADEAGVPSDGMVFEVDNQVSFNLKESGSMYSTGNIAIKLGPWATSRYRSVVKSIMIGSQLGPKETKSVRLLIEPTQVDTGETVTKVGGFNLGYLQRLGIVPGTEIYFVHQSQAVGVLEGVVKDGDYEG